MNTSIAALKRSKSNLDTLIGELSKVAEPQKQTNSYQDDRFWKPELDMHFKVLVAGLLKTV